MLRFDPKFFGDCCFVSDEWVSDLRMLRFVEWTTVELGFPEGRGKELAAFAVRGFTLYRRNVPPVALVDPID